MKHLCFPQHLLCHFLVFCGLGNLLLIHTKMNPTPPLQINDIRLLATPPRIQMTIRKSKTDQRGKTFTLIINSAKAQLICPVRAMQKYLLMRPTDLCDQLFIH